MSFVSCFFFPMTTQQFRIFVHINERNASQLHSLQRLINVAGIKKCTARETVYQQFNSVSANRSVFLCTRGSSNESPISSFYDNAKMEALFQRKAAQTAVQWHL